MNATERLSRERRAQIMDRLMAMLEEHHRFSERIEPVAPTMLARQAAGAYNDLEESARATAVTTTLRHASDDDRLGVRFTAQSERDPPPDTAGENAAELNFGFELVERLTDNIGLLVVKTLSAAEEPGAAHAPSAAITFIAHTTR